MIKRYISYEKGLLHWFYGKENLKYSLPIIGMIYYIIFKDLPLFKRIREKGFDIGTKIVDRIRAI